jgi:hypothetical protein
LAQRRMTARLCALFKAYTGSRPRSRKLWQWHWFCVLINKP